MSTILSCFPFAKTRLATGAGWYDLRLLLLVTVDLARPSYNRLTWDLNIIHFDGASAEWIPGRSERVEDNKSRKNFVLSSDIARQAGWNAPLCEELLSRQGRI
jgi:hypothetical protein